MLSQTLLALFGPPALPAEPAIHDVPLTFDWSADPGCPGRDEVVAMLATYLPSLAEIPASTDRSGRAAASARVTSEGSSWQVELEITGEHGVEQRSFAAESCAVAAEATVLVIAVSIDPIETLETTMIAPQRLPKPEPRPEPPPSPELESSPPGETIHVHFDELDAEPDRPARARVGLGLRGGGGFGPLRAGSGLLVLHFAAFGRGWRWEARGGWLPPVSIDLGEGRRGRFDGWLIGTRGCGVPSRRRLEFPLCLGIEAGQIRGEGRSSVPNPVRATQPWVAVEFGPSLTWAPVPRVALGLEIDAMIPLLAAGFSITGDPAVRTTPVGVRALAGLEIRFP